MLDLAFILVVFERFGLGGDATASCACLRDVLQERGPQEGAALLPPEEMSTMIAEALGPDEGFD